jgi:NADH-quinone oxidoreductase subunit J
MAQSIAFWILAAIALGSAIGVVSWRNIFRSALSLVVCFLAIAGIFVTLSADFLGMAQILIYVGAVAVLIIMSIMMTHEIEHSNLSNKIKLPALAAAALFMGVAIWAVIETHWPETQSAATETTIDTLGKLMFGQDGYILLVEIAALIILATIIGAISITREK